MSRCRPSSRDDGGRSISIGRVDAAAPLRGLEAQGLGLRDGPWTFSDTPCPGAPSLSLEPQAPEPLFPLDYTRTLMTTRRFLARPSLVLFGAIGLSAP
jgi:hypothetical protein